MDSYAQIFRVKWRRAGYHINNKGDKITRSRIPPGPYHVLQTAMANLEISKTIIPLICVPSTFSHVFQLG